MRPPYARGNNARGTEVPAAAAAGGREPAAEGTAFTKIKISVCGADIHGFPHAARKQADVGVTAARQQEARRDDKRHRFGSYTQHLTSEFSQCEQRRQQQSSLPLHQQQQWTEKRAQRWQTQRRQRTPAEEEPRVRIRVVEQQKWGQEGHWRRSETRQQQPSPAYATFPHVQSTIQGKWPYSSDSTRDDRQKRRSLQQETGSTGLSGPRHYYSYKEEKVQHSGSPRRDHLYRQEKVQEEEGALSAESQHQHHHRGRRLTQLDGLAPSSVDTRPIAATRATNRAGRCSPASDASTRCRTQVTPQMSVDRIITTDVEAANSRCFVGEGIDHHIRQRNGGATGHGEIFEDNNDSHSRDSSSWGRESSETATAFRNSTSSSWSTGKKEKPEVSVTVGEEFTGSCDRDTSLFRENSTSSSSTRKKIAANKWEEVECESGAQDKISSSPSRRYMRSRDQPAESVAAEGSDRQWQDGRDTAATNDDAASPPDIDVYSSSSSRPTASFATAAARGRAAVLSNAQVSAAGVAALGGITREGAGTVASAEDRTATPPAGERDKDSSSAKAATAATVAGEDAAERLEAAVTSVYGQTSAVSSIPWGTCSGGEGNRRQQREIKMDDSDIYTGVDVAAGEVTEEWQGEAHMRRLLPRRRGEEPRDSVSSFDRQLEESSCGQSLSRENKAAVESAIPAAPGDPLFDISKERSKAKRRLLSAAPAGHESVSGGAAAPAAAPVPPCGCSGDSCCRLCGYSDSCGSNSNSIATSSRIPSSGTSNNTTSSSTGKDTTSTSTITSSTSSIDSSRRSETEAAGEATTGKGRGKIEQFVQDEKTPADGGATAAMTTVETVPAPAEVPGGAAVGGLATAAAEEPNEDKQELRAYLRRVEALNEILLTNISSLYKTAKAELEKKDAIIAEKERQIAELSSRLRERVGRQELEPQRQRSANPQRNYHPQEHRKECPRQSWQQQKHRSYSAKFEH